MSDNPDTKPDVSSSADEHLNIKVKDSSGGEVFFKVKKTTKLSKLMKAYADRMGTDASAVRFMFDGSRVQKDDTAESLGLEDDDEIEVMTEQIGGVQA